MKKEIKNAIECLQCPGCVTGSDTSCFEPGDSGVGCGKHTAGTIVAPYIGTIFLGMPTGFNRLGPAFEHENKDTVICIFEKFEDGWGYDKFNIAAWKHLDENGYTLIRGLSPRVNHPFIHVFLEECMDKLECLEITKEDINAMD